MATTNTPTTRVLLGVTGSVAAVKAPELVVSLLQTSKRYQVDVVLTVGGKHFWDRARHYDESSWHQLVQLVERKQVRIHYADDEWKSWNQLGDPVSHIELRNQSDVFVIAPLSAHTLAKLANGLCDDTLSCVARAWKSTRPMVVAPAMNTHMWDHPLTSRQLEIIQSFGRVSVVAPVSKVLACGDTGDGALAPVDVIIEAIQESLS